MSAIETIEGTLRPDGSLDLDHKPTLSPGRVSIVLQPAPTRPAKRGLADVLDEIHRDQQVRGFVGRTAEEIEVGLSEGDEEYDNQMQ